MSNETQPSPLTPTAKRPLKILQIGSHFPGWGGTELHMINLSEQLTRRGHDVTVLCRPGRFVETEAKKRDLKILNATVVNHGDWDDQANIRQILKRGKFDIAHAHWRPDYLVVPTIARFMGVPVVLLSHHSPIPFKKKDQFWYVRVLFSRMIALSESVRRMLIANKVPAEKLVTIHHGTDTEAFRRTTKSTEETRAAWRVPEGQLVVGIVGRIAQEKGIIELLNAFANVRHLPIHLIIVGNGPHDLQVRHLQYSLGLLDRVTFGGFRSDVNNAIAALDVLVLASTWQEPCAAVLQQAMALNKPVIGTDAGGTPEMVAHNDTGIIVPPSDVDALANALCRVAAMSQSERDAMGARGRVRVDSLFTLAGMTDKNEALYYRELAAKGK